jgi:hypothetical protein
MYVLLKACRDYRDAYIEIISQLFNLRKYEKTIPVLFIIQECPKQIINIKKIIMIQKQRFFGPSGHMQQRFIRRNALSNNVFHIPYLVQALSTVDLQYHVHVVEVL